MPTVLVVEESALVRELLQRSLAAEGYTVFAATGGSSALCRVRTHAVDLVLLDLDLVASDGLTFLRHLRALPRGSGLPVVVYTGVRTRTLVLEAARLRVAAYLLKDEFSMESLRGAIERALAGPHAVEGGEGGSPHEEEPPTGGATAARPTLGATAAPARFSRVTPSGSARAPAEPVSPADQAERVRSLEQLIPRAEVVERLAGCGQLKAFSPVVAHLLRLTASSECTIDGVVKAVAQDHAVALAILRSANSVVYTRGAPVDSVRTAVLRIGLQRIRQAVMNLAVIESVGATASQQGLDLPSFWEHGISCGLIAAELAHEVGGVEPDTAFTAGLLHDVGRLLMLEALGPVYERVAQEARRLELPLEIAETRLLGQNHADAMETILETWGLSRQLVNPIVLHHMAAPSLRTIAKSQVADVAVLALANRLAHAMVLGSSGNDVVYPSGELCGLLGVPASTVENIQSVVPDQTNDLKLSMLAGGRDQSTWRDRRREWRDLMGPNVRALFASPEPALDAYRVLCERLATGAG
ncbi:MAG TPA: HDOD domain-containing protein, partial [Phycisphaerales bacterium]|nr:HDOD domain-containing protein [Phycisphaerales bacterium]